MLFKFIPVGWFSSGRHTATPQHGARPMTTTKNTTFDLAAFMLDPANAPAPYVVPAPSDFDLAVEYFLEYSATKYGVDYLSTKVRVGAIVEMLRAGTGIELDTEAAEAAARKAGSRF